MWLEGRSHLQVWGLQRCDVRAGSYGWDHHGREGCLLLPSVQELKGDPRDVGSTFKSCRGKYF